MLRDVGVSATTQCRHRNTPGASRVQVNVPAILAVFLNEPQCIGSIEHRGGDLCAFSEKVLDAVELRSQIIRREKLRHHNAVQTRVPSVVPQSLQCEVDAGGE